VNLKHTLLVISVAVLFLGGSCSSQIETAQSPALLAASRSLNDKNQCVSFQWGPTGEKVAITLPVQIEARTYRFQVDTGASANIIYDTLADHAGWSKPADHSFQPSTFRIADTVIHRPRIAIFRDMKVAGGISGTLGLWSLIGRVTVIDYPGRRVCLFADTDLPQELLGGITVNATLRNGKLFVPVQVGNFTSDSILFDTGSSEFPLMVDLANWSKMTGLTEPDKSPVKRSGLTWGRPTLFYGASASAPLKLGKIDLGVPTVFTKQGAPDGFAKMSYKVDGVIGNSELWDGIIILDLTANVQLRYIQ
jgi:hypothetical protein